MPKLAKVIPWPRVRRFIIQPRRRKALCKVLVFRCRTQGEN
jgi:hypothetical protein